MKSLQELIGAIGGFINDILIPFLFTIAFLFFIFNVVRYFIIGAANQVSRDTARQYATWSIIAFVIMVSIWGIVNVLVSGFGIDKNTPICPDYNPGCNLESNSSNNNWGWTNDRSGEFGQ